MSKMSKAIAVLGVVAGLGVAALPLSSYAADGDGVMPQSENVTVQAEVGGSISLEIAAGGSGTFDADTNTLDLGKIIVGAADPITGAIKATVSTNETLNYALTIRTATTETAMKNSNGNSIPAGDPKGSTSAWGYSTDNGTTFKPVPAAATSLLDSDPGSLNGTGETAATADTTITFGVKADASQAPGVYTNQVVITASVK